MAKSDVSTIIADVKLLGDYNISDDDLDSLILKAINFALKRMKQWFLDEGMYRQITATAELTTVALQEYIDLSSTPADFEHHIQLTERTNDLPINLIPFSQYRKLFPDPTADSASSPDVAAIFNDKLFLGPTPSQAISIFLDYVILITKLTSSDSLPFDDKYDELVVAICIEYLYKFLDRDNVVTNASNKKDVKDLYETLILHAVKDVGLRQGSVSRRGDIPFFSPRKVV